MRVELRFCWLVCLAGCLVVSASTLAQPTGEVLSPEAERAVEGLGVVRAFDSTVLGEERYFNIMLPPGYHENPDQSYPVIYLLDGAVNEDYHHVSGLVQFMTAYEMMPPSILVGVANVDRYRDFTPPTTVAVELKNIPNAGGSTLFTQFLGEEVQPYVEASFRTTGPRTLIGQSLGGLLATEILLRSPELFDDYLIVSPSLWWNEERLLQEVEASLADVADRKGRVYVSVGTEGEEMETGAQRLFDKLQAHPSKALASFYAPFPEETHATILHRSLYRAFEWLYGEDYPGM